MTDAPANRAEPAPAAGGRGKLWRLIALVVAVAALGVAAKLLPVKGYFESALEWTEGVGFWGPLAVGAFYVVACVFLLPGSILTIAAGALFGAFWGTVTVSISSTLGASAAFLVGRTLARDWVAQKVAANPKFAAIDEAVGREGFKIVLLTRLSPIFPFNLLNYGYGLTKVGLGKYALASWIGMLPGTVMYVYIGSTLRSLAEVFAGRQKGWADYVFVGVGVALAIVVAVLVARVARRALRQAVPAEAAATEGAAP